jgi:hypothetical protein
MTRAQQRPVLARIHVLLARKGSMALVIRRGPSRQVCTIGWDRKTDTFTLGQWLKGRIYERRCDLSSDGKHFIYFAMNGKWHSEAKGSWTAISKTPYLKAIALWAKGDGWNGGGLFKNAQTFWLNSGHSAHEVHIPARGFHQTDEHPGPHYYGGECPGVYYLRLQRDGWKLVRADPESDRTQVTVFERTVVQGWLLRKLAYETLDHPVGKGCYFDRHVLVNRSSGLELERPGWEWADLDRDRLVWAEDGKILAGKLTKEGLTDTNELADFNGLKFEPLAAPY